MRVSAKADYAVRAAVELAANANDSNSPMKGERISDAQGIPLKFLENILVDLRVAGLVNSRRADCVVPKQVSSLTSEPGAWQRR